LDVGEYQVDVAPLLKDRDSLVRIACLTTSKPAASIASELPFGRGHSRIGGRTSALRLPQALQANRGSTESVRKRKAKGRRTS